MEDTDRKYMCRCLQLAAMAEGMTSPNPMVGAVVVYNDRIIGEGYHHKAGEPHAEPNAINSVKDKELLKYSTLYVSLEPCSHWGKTPPCADLIVRSGIKRVVVAITDPNPQVSGKGIEILRSAGIEVEVGVMSEEARWLNRRFLTFQEKRRPYVILKWAETADGFIDILRKERGNGPLKISNSITKTLNHRIRTTEDAIMVATRTALLDNPHLTVTKWSGKNPVRLLLDRNCRIASDAKIYDKAAKTIVFTSEEGFRLRPSVGENIEFEIVDFNENLVSQVLDILVRHKIESVIIEGGSCWLQTFIDENLWDEAKIEVSKQIIESGVKAPEIDGLIKSTENFDGNIVMNMIPKEGGFY